ncbi:MAG: NADP-dependent malic enzyme [Alphaproteobacteria bacterium]|nr:NADP-dependent malic enzyme [Alphaproteobacteria bacterium]
MAKNNDINPEQSNHSLDEEALIMHASGRPGKLEIVPTKPMKTQRDLSLAYSPGVAAPCLEIHKNPDKAYDYTARGNMVAVISNGTAVLGLGNLGALASKPVMEGKSVLFKRFADVDSIDLEINTEDPEEFINAVKYLGPSFGGINLEDIKSPECFMIEQRLRELMDIPVFHDDQHGTAIISAAGLVSALDITGKNIKDIKLVVNGAGAAAIACVELIKTMGLPHDNVIMCDTKGVIYKGRTEDMNQWKSAHAANTKDRTLADALRGADVFWGLSVANCVTPEMVKAMAKNPAIFAMANPNPEIRPELAREVRPDAIIATGRSDYPNQINNVLGFPYIFRGALDVRARTINDQMKIAAAKALAALAREDVPDEVDAAYGRRLRYGPDYIIPVPFDPRLIVEIPTAVAKAAVESGVARKPITDEKAFRSALRARLDPTADTMELIFTRVRNNPQRVVFAEGEEERMIRAAISFRDAGYGTPILIAREEVVKEKIGMLGLADMKGIEIHNSRVSQHNKRFTEYLFKRLQRRGLLERDCQRMVNQQRNVFAACMVAHGEADAMVTGLSRNFNVCYEDIRKAIDARTQYSAFGLSMSISAGRTIFLADTAVNPSTNPDRHAEIAIRAAEFAEQMGHQPRVALISYSTFGQQMNDERANFMREVVAKLDDHEVSFEYEGEMAPDVALDHDLMKRLYPFCRLTGPANVLIMPSLQAANIATKLMQKMVNSRDGNMIGPLLQGLKRPAQIVGMGATVSEIVTMAALAAHEAIGNAEADKKAKPTVVKGGKAA